MRQMPFRIGSASEIKRQEDPWKRRMPTQVYIGRARPERLASDEAVTFGKRRPPASPVKRPRRSVLARLVKLLQGPRKIRRTKLR